MSRALEILVDDSPSSDFRSESTPHEHRQAALFGKYADRIPLGVNPSASIALIHPASASVDFGIFKIPALSDLLKHGSTRFSSLLCCWGVKKETSNPSQVAFVPPETGRSILLQASNHEIYRDILIKGTGLVERYAINNKLRFADRGFDGHLELSEAERDLVHSAVLDLAGVFVSAGIGVVDHHQLQKYPEFNAWTGNYIRGFRVQTRISNLFEFDLITRRNAIDDAIQRICQLTNSEGGISYTEYFYYILELCAKNAAIMQAIGFTQDSLHYGQITLCGELTDLGIGSFQKPNRRGVINTMHPWFRYERQPILLQNILYKTHAVKAEPEPVRLDLGCRAVREQQTLFGAIRSVCPEAAEPIREGDPEATFWKIYQETYQAFDIESFKTDVLSELNSYFDWRPQNILIQVPRPFVAKVQAHYAEALERLTAHFEEQIATWDRRGPTSIHKQILFSEGVRSVCPEVSLDFSTEKNGIWELPKNKRYSSPTGEIINREEDLSWKPS